MCLYCVSWWCYLRTGHLIVSWFGTAQGYMLDWLGDVTSTVSLCQLSGCVCYPTNHMQICILHMGLYWTYEVCGFFAFCIILNDILSVLSLSFFDVQIFLPLAN